MPAPEPTMSVSGQLKYSWRHEWPRHLVLFGHLLQQDGVKDLLQEKGYREVWRAGREWEGEGTRKGGVRVWKWQP
jgi:phosphatidylinositol glycan class B